MHSIWNIIELQILNKFSWGMKEMIDTNYNMIICILCRIIM
jgi:hypothetical protein